MTGGTILLSRAKLLHSHIKLRLEELGFKNVMVTDIDKDALDFLISENKPDLLMIASGFYQACTPYMIGELIRKHKNLKLNIAVVSVFEYPMSLAPYFIWHGAKSYLNLWEGYEEFHNGLQIIRKGKQYISPKTKVLMELHPDENPDPRNNITGRMQSILIMLCCGLSPEEIGKELHITRKTVYNHIGFLFDTFHVKSRDEMVALAWQTGIVTKNDIRFYSRETNILTLPDWGILKQKINRSLYDFKNKKRAS